MQQDMTRKTRQFLAQWLFIVVPPNHPIFTLLDEISDYNKHSPREFLGVCFWTLPILSFKMWRYIVRSMYLCSFCFEKEKYIIQKLLKAIMNFQNCPNFLTWWAYPGQFSKLSFRHCIHYYNTVSVFEISAVTLLVLHSKIDFLFMFKS